MRIVHYLNHTCKGNGHVAVAVDLACDQVRVGHDVYVISGFGDFDDLLVENGVKVVTLGEASGPFRLLTMARRFLRAVRKMRPDVVNAHMVYAALAAKLVRPLVGFKIVTTVHNSFDQQATLMGVGDLVIVVSEAVKAEMKSRGIAERKLRTVRNGTIGGSRRPLRPERIRQLEHPNIMTVGGLHPRKGIAELIEAFALVRKRNPGAHLYLIGDGPHRAEYEARVTEMGLQDAVHFEGYHKDPREFLGDADIFVLASHAEPFGLVTIEAREMGCAVIVTDVGGNVEAMGGSEKGILVPPRDGSRLAQAINDLLENDSERRRLAEAAASGLEGCTVARMNHETLKVYAELTG